MKVPNTEIILSNLNTISNVFFFSFKTNNKKNKFFLSNPGNKSFDLINLIDSFDQIDDKYAESNNSVKEIEIKDKLVHNIFIGQWMNGKLHGLVSILLYFFI